MQHDHRHGLVHDLRVLALSRRRMLRLLGGAALVPLVGCTASDTTGVGPDADTVTGSDSCATIPSETGGPYPADGTNGVSALTMSGIVRSDIRPSLGAAAAVAGGIVVTTTLTVVDVATGCTPQGGRAVYLWHCDRSGNHSLATDGIFSDGATLELPAISGSPSTGYAIALQVGV